MTENTKFYSGTAPRRIRSGVLPHVTIQCPVYKEGLYSVIEPTVKSIKAAISTYEMQGGSANIFVNDDGMQLIPEEDSQARRDFYDEHNIGWVARPKHNPKPSDGEKGFIRAGKFKKASNMNYALAVSSRVEDKLASIERPLTWTQVDESVAYETCLQQVIAEDEGRTWADGNVRLGDYILLIDSDTRVPQDCFLDAVSEMEMSPQVAIIQYSSGVMNVTDSFFEKGITFFTNLIYTAISYAVANGDVAPFVGHNAVLRWSAVQDIAYTGEDGTEKYWSESTVSEVSSQQVLARYLRLTCPRTSTWLFDCSVPVTSSVLRLTPVKDSKRVSPLLFTMSLPDGRSTLMDVTNSFSIQLVSGSSRVRSRPCSGSSSDQACPYIRRLPSWPTSARTTLSGQPGF